MALTAEQRGVVRVCCESLDKVRRTARELASTRDDHPRLHKTLQDAILDARIASEAASALLFECRSGYVPNPDSKTSHDNLTILPSNMKGGAWAIEVGWLDPYLTVRDVRRLRNSAIKRHGRLRRRTLDQNPISSDGAFASYIDRILRSHVEPMLSMGKRRKLKRVLARANVWLTAAIVLARNAQADDEDGGTFALSYSMASSQLGRKL